MEGWETVQGTELIKLTHLGTRLIRENGKAESGRGREKGGRDGERDHRRNCNVNVRGVGGKWLGVGPGLGTMVLLTEPENMGQEAQEGEDDLHF